MVERRDRDDPPPESSAADAARLENDADDGTGEVGPADGSANASGASDHGSGRDTEHGASEDEAGTPAASDEEGRTGRRSVVFASLRAALGSDSWLLTSYAVVGTLAAVLVGVVVALALPVWVENTLGQSQSVTFSRAFLILSGLLLVAALLAPLLYAHRRDRAGNRSRRSDFLLGASGYVLVASLYLSLVISAPPDQRSTPPAAVAPLVEFLYDVDPTLAVVPPLIAVGLIALAGNS
jgi:hypothetical protein